MPGTYLPILMMLGFATAIAVGILVTSALLGPRSGGERKLSPYESGMPLYGGARQRISVKFFIVAMAFILFDVEVAFVYPWAVAFRDLTRELGSFPLLEMLGFLGVLALGYVYLWRKRILEWES